MWNRNKRHTGQRDHSDTLKYNIGTCELYQNVHSKQYNLLRNGLGIVALLGETLVAEELGVNLSDETGAVSEAGKNADAKRTPLREG